MVGEAGVSPEYFLDRMTLAEAECYMEGYERRERKSWERTRRIAHAVFQSQSTKELDLEDVMRFPWDTEDEDTEEHDSSPESIEALRQRAMKIQERINSKGNGSDY